MLVPSCSPARRGPGNLRPTATNTDPGLSHAKSPYVTMLAALMLGSLLACAVEPDSTDAFGDSTKTSADDGADDGGAGDGTDTGSGPGTGDDGGTGPGPTPTCDDGIQNGEESDVDCGAAGCPACGVGEGCVDNLDCATVWCDSGTCAEASCDDGVKNKFESDVDCGGSECDPCEDGASCNDADDCATELCASGTCTERECDTEADCDEAAECNTVTCAGGVCQTAPAADGSNCGEGCDVGICVLGSCTPTLNLDCENEAGLCEIGSCDAAAMACIFEPKPDGDPCGTTCYLGGTCEGGECNGGSFKDCTMLDDDCNVGLCDVNTGGNCYAEPTNEGGMCDDGDPNTSNDVCTNGTCAGS